MLKVALLLSTLLVVASISSATELVPRCAEQGGCLVPVPIRPVIIAPASLDPNLTHICRNGLGFCYTPTPGEAGEPCQCLDANGEWLFGILARY